MPHLEPKKDRDHFMKNFFENLWGVLCAILITLGLIVLGILVIAGIVMIVMFFRLKSTTDMIEIRHFSIGYLTESAYNNGNFDEASITQEAAFTVGTPQYMVIDFQIKSMEKNEGDTSVKLRTHVSDEAVLSAVIQDASTGKIEILTNEDGSKTYELLYTIPPNKKEEKNVRAILKLVPNADGEVDMDILVAADDDVTLWSGTTGKTLNLHIDRPR